MTARSTLIPLPTRQPPADADQLQVAVRRLVGLRPLRHRLTGTLCVALADAGRRAHPAPLVSAGLRTAADDAVAMMAFLHGPALAGQHDRFDPLTADAVADILHTWVLCRIPVAEHLATAVAPAITLAGGWAAVTDQQLQAEPGARLMGWYLTSQARTVSC